MQDNKPIILFPIPIDELEKRFRAIVRQELASSHLEGCSEEKTEMITVKDVAKLLGVSQVTVHQWKKDGKLKYYRYGSRIRFKKSDILCAEAPMKFKK